MTDRREFLKQIGTATTALGIGMGTSEASQDNWALLEVKDSNESDKILERPTLPDYIESFQAISHVDSEYISLAVLIKNYVLGSPAGLDPFSLSTGSIERLYRKDIKFIAPCLGCKNIVTLKTKDQEQGHITLAIVSDELVLKRLHQYGYFV